MLKILKTVFDHPSIFGYSFIIMVIGNQIIASNFSLYLGEMIHEWIIWVNPFPVYISKRGLRFHYKRGYFKIYLRVFNKNVALNFVVCLSVGVLYSVQKKKSPR